MPNRKELISLIDRGRVNPTIKPESFPGTKIDSLYWTSTAWINGTTFAWATRFSDGETMGFLKTVALYVRCVSSNQTYSYTFTNNGDDTVIESRTGLIWQRCSMGKPLPLPSVVFPVIHDLLGLRWFDGCPSIPFTNILKIRRNIIIYPISYGFSLIVKKLE